MGVILDDVKHQLGLSASDDAFDRDITIAVNSALAVLHQLGVGPVSGFELTTGAETWDDFVNDPRLNAVKTFIYLKVKLVFDPPQSGFAMQSMERQIQELEYRINVVVDYG